ncbi:MAG: trehalose-phosphatase [Acidimicrobiales bacterium]|nr:trehalose-phosphatase [Acidimicrobiales bacterium]
MTQFSPVAVLEPLRREPVKAGIFCDYDGTIAEIVEDPSQAWPLTGITEVLDRLASAYGRVAILSGRPVSFFSDLLPPSVVVSGLYGLESIIDGERHDHPQGGAWREVIDDVVSIARAQGPEGMRVESKGLSLTLHYRGNPEIEPAVREFVKKQAERSGLVMRPARMSYELHPPIAADKGTAVLDLAGELDAVLFIGDDVGDLPAFDALDALAAEGRYTVRVAVRSPEESQQMIARADFTVDGPAGVLHLLEQLLETSGRKAS